MLWRKVRYAGENNNIKSVAANVATTAASLKGTLPCALHFCFNRPCSVWRSSLSLLTLTACQQTPVATQSSANTAPAAASSALNVDERAQQLAQQLLIIDTHIDVPYRLQSKWEDVTVAAPGGEFDYPRAKAGGLNAPFMSVYIPSSLEKSGGGYLLANQLIDSMEALVGRAPDKFAMAYRADDVTAQFWQRSDFVGAWYGKRHAVGRQTEQFAAFLSARYPLHYAGAFRIPTILPIPVMIYGGPGKA